MEACPKVSAFEQCVFTDEHCEVNRSSKLLIYDVFSCGMQVASRGAFRRAAVGIPLSITCGGTGAWMSRSQRRQTHLPRICRSTWNTPGV